MKAACEGRADTRLIDVDVAINYGWGGRRIRDLLRSTVSRRGLCGCPVRADRKL